MNGENEPLADGKAWKYQRDKLLQRFSGRCHAFFYGFLFSATVLLCAERAIEQRGEPRSFCPNASIS
jgi:hypothetical protein